MDGTRSSGELWHYYTTIQLFPAFQSNPEVKLRAPLTDQEDGGREIMKELVTKIRKAVR